MRRHLTDRLMSLLMAGAVLLVLAPAISIFWGVVAGSLPGLSLSLFTTTTSGIAGGLLNAILGSLFLVAGTLLVAGPLAVLGGIYVSEWAPERLGNAIRFTAEVLAGVPSIVLGYVGFATLVLGLHWGFSSLAGILTLSVLVLPYILRSTDITLRQTPVSYREAAVALGASPSFIVFRILLLPALPGILTGVLVALGIALGETAPLIYTAGWSDTLPTAQLVHSPIGYLTYVVWTYMDEPYPAAHALAYSAALLLLVIIGILIALSRGVSAWYRRRMSR